MAVTLEEEARAVAARAEMRGEGTAAFGAGGAAMSFLLVFVAVLALPGKARRMGAASGRRRFKSSATGA